jgi:DHA1 family bicyclomycin/chloramphenicol resistance-like MFS transporter
VCVTLPLAIVRDLLEGVEARHRLSQITAVVGVAPLLAPILGSWTMTFGGWRAIYAAQAVAGLLLISVVAARFVETLPEHRRQFLNLRHLCRNYGRVLGTRAFLGSALAYALGFACLFAYVSGSPAVLMRSIGLSDQMFSIVFGVTSLSLIFGSMVSARLSTAQVPSRRVIAACLGLMALGAGCTLAVAWGGSVRLATIMPCVAVVVFCFGLLAPTATHEALRPLPDMAGAASGALRSLQMLIGAGSGALVTLIVGAATPALAMASVMAALAAGAVGAFVVLLGWSEPDRKPRP